MTSKKSLSNELVSTIKSKEHLIDLLIDRLTTQELKNIDLRQKLVHAENNLHIADVNLDNCKNELHIYKCICEEQRQQIDRQTEKSVTMSSVQIVAVIDSADDLKESVQESDAVSFFDIVQQLRACTK